MKPVVINDVSHEDNHFVFSIPGGVTISVPRLDYIDEDTFDLINAALTDLDVNEQMVAVANDIAAAPVGTELKWQPLLDGTKAKLAEFGVEVSRVVTKDGRHDQVVAPTLDVVEALQPFSEQRPRPLRKRGRDIALAMLEPVVTAAELAELSKLRTGQLDRILALWRKHSSVTEGE